MVNHTSREMFCQDSEYGWECVGLPSFLFRFLNFFEVATLRFSLYSWGDYDSLDEYVALFELAQDVASNKTRGAKIKQFCLC